MANKPKGISQGRKKFDEKNQNFIGENVNENRLTKRFIDRKLKGKRKFGF